MNVKSVAAIAGLIGESGRIQMLALLLDGSRHSASELAIAADVSAQTASSHLSKLMAGGLIVSQRNGRQRLFRLKNRDVAVAIEALVALAQERDRPAMPEIRYARTCYDHLAGALAVALRKEFLQRGALRYREGHCVVTSAGKRLLLTLDLDVDELSKLRRSFASDCLDWTERQHHIGGALGATLLFSFFRRNWLARVRGSRVVRVTHAGEVGFEKVFGIRCAEVQARSYHLAK
jgi:DNA-binding transcriptional ArsR family regulator